MKALLVAIANYLCDELTKEGLIVHRVDSDSSNSIYLKLDWGAAHTIRISDHLEKRHLQFRYNIGTHINRYRLERNPTQYYFPVTHLDRMVNSILSDRTFQLTVRGQQGYIYLVKAKINRDHELGNQFWERAQLYTGGKV